MDHPRRKRQTNFTLSDEATARLELLTERLARVRGQAPNKTAAMEALLCGDREAVAIVADIQRERV